MVKYVFPEKASVERVAQEHEEQPVLPPRVNADEAPDGMLIETKRRTYTLNVKAAAPAEGNYKKTTKPLP